MIDLLASLWDAHKELNEQFKAYDNAEAKRQEQAQETVEISVEELKEL